MVAGVLSVSPPQRTAKVIADPSGEMANDPSTPPEPEDIDAPPPASVPMPLNVACGGGSSEARMVGATTRGVRTNARVTTPAIAATSTQAVSHSA